ncbi:hypothetical protein ACQP00_24980 [Dactylosporangium sp. CS-047395]|uniref:hypothetical protein n=1 Tax=Dactylosporangium sp. CS-047395 TaxID=3239936 RepID=UPI003D94A6CC
MASTLPVMLLDLDGVLNPFGAAVGERAAPTLLVEIDPAVGWTRPDIDRVLAWCGALR